MLNGDITAWRFEEISDVFKGKVKPHYLGRYSTKLKRISSMHWHPTSEFGKFYIFVILYYIYIFGETILIVVLKIILSLIVKKQ